MPQLGIRTPIARGRANASRQHPKAYLATVTGLKCFLPLAPQEVDLDGYSAVFETLEREGRKPVVSRTGAGLRSLSTELAVVSQTLGKSVQPALDQLIAIAGANSRVTFSYGRTERGLWRITRCGITVTERAPYTNDATKAIVRLSLLEASDVAVKVGPLTGGAVKPPAKPQTGAVRQLVRTHRVVRGDTLAAIALRYYGTAAVWPQFAKANKVRDPRKLKPGTVLTIVPLAGTTSAPVRPGGVDLRRTTAEVRRILIAAGWIGTQLDNSDHVVYPPTGTTGVVRSRIVARDAGILVAAGFTRRTGDKIDTLYPPARLRAT